MLELIINDTSYSARAYLLSMGDQPTRGLNAEWHANQEHNGWYSLHGDWYDPSLLPLLCCKRARHTSSPDTTKMNQNLDVAGKKTSERCWREFCLIRGDERLDDADCEIGQDATNRELNPA